MYFVAVLAGVPILSSDISVPKFPESLPPSDHAAAGFLHLTPSGPFRDPSHVTVRPEEKENADSVTHFRGDQWMFSYTSPV